MNKDEIETNDALRRLRKKEILREKVCQPGYRYYLQGGIIGILSAVVSVGFIFWMMSKEKAPVWGVMVFALAVMAFVETTRQRERLNAMLELSELEKNEATNNPVVIAGDQPYK